MNQTTSKHFLQHLVLLDEPNWIWSFLTKNLKSLKLDHLRVPSNIQLRASWERLKESPYFIIHWESKLRSGGAIIEDILAFDQSFDVAERIIVLSEQPLRQDVVYFHELGLRKILIIRNREKDLMKAGYDLKTMLTANPAISTPEKVWKELLGNFDRFWNQKPSIENLKAMKKSLFVLKSENESARYLDAQGCIAYFESNPKEALHFWELALEKNPNYYRTYHNLIKFYRLQKNDERALKLMEKMQELNQHSISRLVAMGDIQLIQGDYLKSESFFQSALSRDQYSCEALNGLAEIRFHQGQFEDARKLLAQSTTAFKTAQRLNQQGVNLVKAERFREALDHYINAQYVLPQQDKGPLLFYNIGLCYARWGKLSLAQRFLKIAMIKDPHYTKAENLLQNVQMRLKTQPA